MNKGQTMKGLFAGLLENILRHDSDYETRNGLIFHALFLANILGYPAGIRIDPAEPEWPVVFIELPGEQQVSWHLPQFSKPWDGHTTADKFARIVYFVDSVRR